MSDDNISRDVSLPLKVMINKERNKVLFAVADSQFTDILLSFLTLPLGRIVKLLEKQYGDEAPAIGSLSNLYRTISDLDGAHFSSEGAKKILLNPISSFEDEYKRLKLDITDSPPPEFFYCDYHFQYGTTSRFRFRSVSMYYDTIKICYLCGVSMSKIAVSEASEVSSSNSGVLTIPQARFIISDDLQIFPSDTGLVSIIDILGITDDVTSAKEIQVELGLNEISKLLSASLTSSTPLSDVILNQTTKTSTYYSTWIPPVAVTENDKILDSRCLSLKVATKKSTGKFLYAQAKADFIDFLFSFLLIPVGGFEHLLSGKTLVKPINNLYRSANELRDEYFKSPDSKKRLINPSLPHGCISRNHILPLSEEPLPAGDYIDHISSFSSVNFPKGQGIYLQPMQTYKVMDDLTVEPFCAMSTLSGLKKLKIEVSDVKEVELRIGLKEV